MTQTIALDTFAGTNFTDLHNHTGDSGITWARNAATPSARFLLFDGKTYCDTVQGSAGAALYCSAVPFSADYYVEADITIVTNVGFTGIALRMSTTANTYYFGYPDAGGNWVLAKRVNGTITTLDAGGTVSPGTYLVRLEAVGTAITLDVDGVQLASATDSAITDAGRGGVRAGSATQQKYIDNFTIVDGSAPIVSRSYAIGLVGL